MIRELKRIPTDLSTLGARMRYARVCCEYSVVVLARQTEFSQNDVSKWEQGQKRITHQQLRLWAYYCKVPVKWLVEGGDPPCRPKTIAERIMAQVDISPEAKLIKLRKARPRLNQLPNL